MNFSDWITVVSILAALVLATFKFYEWQIIQRKKVRKYLILPMIFLILSGITAYFKSNGYPQFLSFFWLEYGLDVGLYSLIYLIVFVSLTYFQWNKFTKQKPNENLIHLYHDLLSVYTVEKFAAIFRKYEKYFFDTSETDHFAQYESLLLNPLWWEKTPNYFKDTLFYDSKQLFELDDEILKTIIKSQLRKLPHSLLAKELQKQSNGIHIDESHLILNSFLGKKEVIDEGVTKNVFLPTIKEEIEEYFHSIEFIKKDHQILSLPPTNEAFKQVAPKSQPIFFYIELINCFWCQVIDLKASTVCFRAYKSWADYLIERQQSIDNKESLYKSAIDKMFGNIRHWMVWIYQDEIRESMYYLNFFPLLYLEMIESLTYKGTSDFQDNYYDQQLANLLSAMCESKRVFGEEFNPEKENKSKLDNIHINHEIVENAFKILENDKFYDSHKQKSDIYLWIKGIKNQIT